ncbi:Arm DNA-binding domain-containing protein [Trichlorobacter ammonificans]|uniref:Integrase n=1 Tax=Trichlorobacter ammonificans TaxID=2916410 RepID=A0ABM9DAV8_9BACT|nr:tyrosine-type recombinase/integrase [Trichlorobacter ammonificans]CAH2032317.1 Integrase [Trichlorobacter ammonificans]
MRTKKGMLALEQPAKQFGRVKRRKDSCKLYIDFYYFGHRIIRSTELDDTPANEQKVRDFLNRIGDRVEKGTFKFAEAFPGASRKEKAFFTKLEGREYRPEPHNVLFGDYVKEWMKTIFPTFGSPTKHRDYQEAIRRMLPHFKNLTFHQITGQELYKFTETLKWKTGPNKGKPLSRARKVNILIPFRAIWNDACDHYRWVIKNPCDGIHKKLPKTEKKERLALRFRDWQLFLESLEEHYRPIAELMILTGMIVSEMAALTKDSIQGDYLKLTSSYVLKNEKSSLKTAFRKRDIYITDAIRKRLDILVARATTPYLVTSARGSRLHSTDFAKVWKKAVDKAGIAPMTSYTARHTFAAWALTIGVNPLRLVKLMGHASKQMVYEVYGNYVEGLEEDAVAILDYFGRDFIEPRKKKNPALYGYSTGHSQGIVKPNYLIPLSY